MRRLLISLSLLLLNITNLYGQGSGTPSTLRVKTDANGYLLVESATQTNPVTTSVFSNTRLRTDADGSLLVVLTGTVTPTYPLAAPVGCASIPYSFTTRTSVGLCSPAADTWALYSNLATLWTGSNSGNLSSNISGQSIGTVSWLSSVGSVTSTSLDIFAIEDASLATRFDGIHSKLLLNPAGAVTGEKTATSSTVETSVNQNFGVVQAARNSAYKTGTGSVTTLRGTRSDVVAVNGNVTTLEAGFFQAITQEGADTVTNIFGIEVLSQLGGSSPIVSSIYGAFLTAQLGSGSSANVDEIVGVYNQAFNSGGSGDVTDLIGIYNIFGNFSGSGDVTNAYGSRVEYSGSGNAPTTTYGYYVAALTGTTQYSFYNNDNNAPMFSLAPLRLLTTLAQTVSNPVIDSSQTWNAGAVAFTAWKLNITDTASDAASLLIDLQVGGSSRFNVSKAGSGIFAGSVNSATGIFSFGSQGILTINGNGQYSFRNAAQTSGFGLTVTSNGIGMFRSSDGTAGGTYNMLEQTAPAAPSANEVNVYAVDNGGKTELCARFNTGGACIRIAIEP